MIRLVDGFSQEFLLHCENSAFGCKIYSTALAYGFDYKFASFWLSEVTFCLWGGNMTISGEIENINETLAFLQMISPENVLCSESNSLKLGIVPFEGGEILQKSLKDFQKKK